MNVKALLFDLNGTMIDDMEFHTRAWRDMFNNELGANLSWEDTKKEMYGKNQEVLIRVFGEGRFTQDEINALSIEKETRYQKEFLPHLKLLPGLQELLNDAYNRDIPMGIGSAAIPFNINFVLDKLHLHKYFKSIVSADDVKTSKPHPETFLNIATQLNIAPENCLVLEDTPKGAETAFNAGMKCAILTTTHEQSEFSHLDNIVHFSADYTDSFFKALFD
ncbi:HAD family hydrolase [Mucilaginibacter sp.]